MSEENLQNKEGEREREKRESERERAFECWFKKMVRMQREDQNKREGRRVRERKGVGGRVEGGRESFH